MVETTWDVLLRRLERLDKVVTGLAEIHPYASLAWSVISAANKVLINQKNLDDRIVRLSGTMSDAFSFLDDIKFMTEIGKHAETITQLLQQVTECGYFIAQYAKDNFLTRTAKYAMADIDQTIAAYENSLRDLKTALLEGVAVQTGMIVVRVMNVVDDFVETNNLNKLPRAEGARFQSEKGCLPGTREAFLKEICNILNNPDGDAPRVCLLTGVAGSGKSAVAHSIARLYHEQKRLGSSYCFSRSEVAQRNPTNLFTTIARDLSSRDPQYKAALCQVLKDDEGLCTSQSRMDQLERLVIEPWQDLHAIGPLVIVIDALDESGDPTSRQHILRALSAKIANNSLPSHLRFLITARLETDIRTELAGCPRTVHKQMSEIPEDVVDGDIETFIRHSLHNQYTELESFWPGGEWCRRLRRHSQKLFQWASTACDFVRRVEVTELDLRERVEVLLQVDNTKGIHPLDELYQTILEQLFTLDGARPRFQKVMAVVLALHEPLSINSLSALSIPRLNIREIIKSLGSLLDGVLDDEKPIRPLHTSFRDFLLDKARSSIFHVDIQSQHSLRLGRALLTCMRTMLRFNICDLKDSRIRNVDIPDLPTRVNTAIPPHLAYSCRYWMHHLQRADCTPDLLNEVTLFFKDMFPYWLEAISLLSLSSPLSTILSALETCTTLRKWTKDQETATLASEAFQFIQVFAPVLRESTPHLYLSAMPQTPTSSPICNLWVEHLQKHVSFTSGHPATWPVEVHTLYGHTDSVLSVAYSPDGSHIVSGSRDKTIRVWNASIDGSHIVSGSEDNTIRVWNASTGQCVAGPFQGHTDSVLSVAYSPDGSYIVSSSWDNTIMVWNASTGQCVAGPFQGHTDSVSSIAYSPDGSHIVSGSSDNTIMVWNASTGQCVAGPFQGHTYSVLSVAYSPDGSYIVSGSSDKTIRVWNARTGQCVAGPFQGHTYSVWSVAYSPDGSHIISGSSDNTIMVWNATTGQCVAGPFQGHTDSVSSVAYSPDGSHIVSGSRDNTIRVWNASTGQCVAGPFQGCSDSVLSVAYSPNGSHVVSGSRDNTIRVWNASTGQCVAGPFQGHTDSVSSVAYSPDGSHIVSGSWDNTIRVWNSSTGQCVADPFQGHTDSVLSVAYSPDGSHIVSGSSDNTVGVWNASTGQCVADPFQGHTNSILSVAYSPDGSHIVSGSWDNTIRAWDLNASTGQCVTGPFQGHTYSVSSVAYSPDGSHIVSGSWDNTIRVWNASTGQCVAGPFQGHTDSVLSVAYSPDGSHVVSGSSDNTIMVWNASTGQCVAGPFQGHTYSVSSVAYSPAGSHIVTVSSDLSIKMWRTQNLVFFDALSFDKHWVLSSNGALFGWIAPWNINSYLPIHSLIISSNRIYQADVDISLFGESWISCWH
ncbi:Quinonprotein alcohol dehydrogenase-like superfamily [Tylopilus felleus]